MLVIDRVELAELNKPHQMRELQRNDAFRLQGGCQSRREIIDIRDMREARCCLRSDQPARPSLQPA
jgi:hypothetical protein